MPAICREGDTLTTGHACTGTTTLDTPQQSTVRANSILIARVGDATVSHPAPPNHLVLHTLDLSMLVHQRLEFQVLLLQE
jgi:hypothetical protein